MTSIGLIIVGASGHGREVADAAREAVAADRIRGVILGFVDDDPALRGKAVAGLDVIGDTSTALLHASKALLGVGYPESKWRVVRREETGGFDWLTLIHPRAAIGDRVSIERGSFIQAGCVLTCDIQISEFVTINSGTSINHDARIGRLATLCPGVRIGGNVVIGEGAFIGIGASVKQGITIGEWCVIGAGAAVISDVPANAVVAGVPARIINTREPGWHLE